MAAIAPTTHLFSANDSFCTYIGLMEGENIQEIKVAQIRQHTIWYRFVWFLIKKKKSSLLFVAKRFIIA